MAYIQRFRGRPASSGVLAMLLILLGAGLFGVLMGLVTSAFQPSFVAKVAVLLLGLLVVVFAVFSVRWGQVRSREQLGRRVLYAWMFLLGAFPWYLPFKFGPLPGMNPVRLCFMLLLGILALELFASADARARLKERMRRAPLTFGLLGAMVSWMVVCSFTSVSIFGSLDMVAKLWVHGAVMFVAVMVFVRGSDDVLAALRALVLGAVVASLVAFVEWRLQANVFARFFPRDSDALEGLEWILIDKSRLGNYRVSGTAAHPLALAEYLAATLPAILYLLFGENQRRWRVVAAISLPITLAALYLTHTRTGLVSGAFASIAMLFGIAWSWIRNREKRFGKALTGWFGLLATIALGIAVVLVAQLLLEGRNRIEASSTNARVVMLKGTKHLVQKSPIVGYGPGFAAEVLNHRAPSGALTIDSYYMSVSIEAGLVGLALFVALTCTAFTRLFGHGFGEPDHRWLLRVVMAGGILSMLVMKIGLSLTHNFDLMLVLLAASVVLTQPRRRTTGPHLAHRSVAPTGT